MESLKERAERLMATECVSRQEWRALVRELLEYVPNTPEPRIEDQDRG